MFVALNPINKKRRTRKKLYPKKLDTLPCYLLDLPIIKGTPDWKGVMSNEKLLIPVGIAKPNSISSYGSDEWKLKICTLIAKRMLKSRIQDFAFYDDKGEYTKYFEILAPLSQNCTVFTSNKRVYENCCDNLYKSYGCCIRVNSMLGIKNGIAVALKDNIIKLPQFKYITAENIPQNAIKIPKYVISNLPIKASNIDLSEALCTSCGLGDAEDYIDNSFYPWQT